MAATDPEPRKEDGSNLKHMLSHMANDATNTGDGGDFGQMLRSMANDPAEPGVKPSDERARQHNVSHILHAVHSSVWAIQPEKMQAILAFLDMRVRGVSLSVEERAAVTARKPGRPRSISGAVAVLPLFGVLSQRMNMLTDVSGGTSTELFGKDFDAAMADESVGAVVIDTDSPGGEVTGVPELAAKVYGARGSKPVIAVVNSLMASAAYWIASQATEIVITPSGDVGSVGVLAVHTEFSEADKQAGVKTTLVSAGQYKDEGNPIEPLSNEARAEMQRRVDEFYAMFVADVARGRDVKPGAVRNGYGQGRTLGANDAMAEGMVDRIATLDDVLADLTSRQRAKASRHRAQAERDRDLDLRRR